MALDSMTSFPANGLQRQNLYAHQPPDWTYPVRIARAANAMGPGFSSELVLSLW